MSTTDEHQHRTPTGPTQIRLPGQTAAPEGPVDMYMMYVMHHAFRRDLDRFDRGSPVHPGHRPGRLARCSQQRWQVFAEALHGHHTGEDAGLWPLLLERGTAEDVETLEAMEAEHAEFDPLLDGLRGRASTGWPGTPTTTPARRSPSGSSPRGSAWPGTSSTRRPAPSRSSSACCHPGGLGAARRGALQGGPRPRQGRARSSRGRPYGVPREVLDDVFAKTGLGFKVVWLLTRRRFARREARPSGTPDLGRDRQKP